MRKRSAVATLLCLGIMFPATPAVAAGLSPPVADCQLNGHLTRSYTQAQLRDGLATMPVDIREYSGCYDVLRQALLQKIGKLGGGAGEGGGSFLPVWLIVVLVVLALGGAGFGVLAWRNRGRDPDSG